MEDKEQFGAGMEAQLKQWQEKIKQSAVKAEERGPAFLEQYAHDLEDLSVKYDEVRYKLTLLRGSSGKAWEELRVGLVKAFDEMKHAVNKAMERF